MEGLRGTVHTPMGDVLVESSLLGLPNLYNWLGAIGVARVMALVDPNGGEPNGPRVVEMLKENLATVPARVLTPAGKSRMPALRAELEKFLADLERETDGLRNL